jgi:hypothetical protein
VAGRIASAARAEAGEDAGLAECREAIARCAATAGATLMPDHVALTRANNAMMKLDAMIDRMKLNGGLREFNREFKNRRAAALAEGRGFMNYSTALRRLKLILIPSLASGKPVAWAFAEVFEKGSFRCTGR